MLKNISNLGKTLNKAEQKSINGGRQAEISQSSSQQCVCSGPGPRDYWSGSVSSCSRCFSLCSGNAVCIG